MSLLRCAALTLALAASPALAQTAESSLLGTVRDSVGTMLAGVPITARNVATGGQWTVASSSTGRFAFVQLPLGGPYTITARRIGYRPETRSGYELTLGSRVVIDFTLRRAAAELEPMRVTASGRERLASSAGTNLRVSGELLSAIPAVNRDFTDQMALAATAGAQSSLLGQRWTSTDVRIDGAQSRNMLRAGEMGAGPFTLSLEAIRELEVTTTAYDVTQGRQGGGTVRAATRAGTNDWSGSAFTYYRGSGLTAPTDFQGRSRTQREFTSAQWGGSAGGPIVRDRLHLFVAFDRQDSNEPLFTGAIETGADEIAAGVARDSLTRLLRILGTAYGMDSTRPQLGRIDRRAAANTIFARLDWRVNETHQLTLTNDYGGWTSPLSGGVDQPIALFEARSNYRTTENASLATLRSLLASGVQNELRVGLSWSDRRLTPNSAAPRGFVRIQSALANGSRGDTRVQFGGNRLAPDDSREAELQLIDHAYVQRGDVLYTVGTDNTLTRLATYIAESQSGLFEFNSLADLEAKRAFRYSRTLPLVDAQPVTHQRVMELGAFAQAEWRPNARVGATVGLRWDGTAFLDAPARNLLVEEVLGDRTDRRPSDWTKLQPRVQIVWDVDGTGRDLVRVGGGRFAAQAPYYVQHNQLLNDGARIADITLTGAAVPVPEFARYRDDPATSPGLPAGAAAPPPYVNLVDPEYRSPSVWKGSVSYRRQVVEGRLVVTGSLMATRTTSDYMYVDRNLRATPAFVLGNEGSRPVFVAPNTIDAQGRTLNQNALASPRLGRVLELTSSGEGRQHAAIIETSGRLPGGAVVDASYTYNRSFDNTSFGCCLARTATTFTAIRGDPRDLSGSWGPSDLDFRHRVVVAGTVPMAWGLQLGARYVGSNGRPFSAVVNGDINGDEAASNDLAFVFDPDDPATPAAVAASMRRVLANPDNVARDYLRANLGRVAPRNGVMAPWTERIDLRLTKAVGTRAGQSMELGLDVFNVANLVNRDWGAEYQLPVGISSQNPVVQRLPLLNVTGFDQGSRSYTYTVNESFGVLQKGGNPYQLQLSARYRF